MGVVFFPRVTDELTKKARIDSANYQFFYEMEGKASALSAKRQGKMLALEDERDLWDLSQDGLLIEKVIDIDHPAVLFGENGVAPSDAYAALCIIWTCKALSQTGVIYPCSGEYGSEGVHVRFRHRFAPGTLKDDLTLEASLYLKTAACDVPEKEAHLMNEAGALLGSLEEPCQVNFKGNSMSFPMGEIDAPGDPLWWVE